MSLIGPSRRLVRCSDMSGVEVKANSKSMASFGRDPYATLAAAQLTCPRSRFAPRYGG